MVFRGVPLKHGRYWHAATGLEPEAPGLSAGSGGSGGMHSGPGVLKPTVRGYLQLQGHKKSRAGALGIAGAT